MSTAGQTYRGNPPVMDLLGVGGIEVLSLCVASVVDELLAFALKTEALHREKS